jgi:hypothetical protein
MDTAHPNPYPNPNPTRFILIFFIYIFYTLYSYIYLYLYLIYIYIYILRADFFFFLSLQVPMLYHLYGFIPSSHTAVQKKNLLSHTSPIPISIQFWYLFNSQLPMLAYRKKFSIYSIPMLACRRKSENSLFDSICLRLQFPD